MDDKRLVDRLEMMREVMALKMADTQKIKKEVYDDKNSKTRSLYPGDLVINKKNTGLTPKLTEATHQHLVIM